MAANLPPLNNPEEMARWAQAAWALLGEDRPNVLDAWREKSGQVVRPSEEPQSVDTFARRQQRIREGKAQPNRTPGTRRQKEEGERRAAILEATQGLEPVRLPEPAGSPLKLLTRPVANRLRAAAGKAPPIPIGTDHVPGAWFKELAAAAGITLSGMGEAAGVHKNGVHWVLRDARGPLAAERRVALLRAVRRLAGHLYSEAEWDYLESRVVPVPVVHCRDCRVPMVAASVKARPVCESCAAKRGERRAAPGRRRYFTCGECRKRRSYIPKRPNDFARRYCEPCVKERRRRECREYQRARRAVMTPAEREVAGRYRRLYYQRKRPGVQESNRRYSQAHAEEIRQKQERYRRETREQRAAYTREWRQRNRLKMLVYENSPERRAAKLADQRRRREAQRNAT